MIAVLENSTNDLFSKRHSGLSCILCEKRKATKTNSHLITRSFVDTVFGKAGKEEIHTFRPIEGNPFNVYFGREKLIIHDTKISDSHLSADYIFCPECEKLLGSIESFSSYLLKEKVKLQNFREKYQRKNIADTDIKKLCFPINEQAKHRIFFISLLWRFCMLLRFTHGKEIGGMEPSEVNSLRYELLNYFDIEKHYFESASLYCFTCIEKYPATMDALFFHPERCNPYEVRIGRWYIYFEFGKPLRNWKRKYNEVEINFPIECGSDNSNFSAGIIPLSVRSNIQTEFLLESGNKYGITVMAQSKSISIEAAEYLLEREARKIQEENRISYHDAFRAGFRKFCP